MTTSVRGMFSLDNNLWRLVVYTEHDFHLILGFKLSSQTTLVPIKMLVSSLTTLHTPRQTLSFSTVSKEQPLFKSVTGLNPVFQPILTVTIVTVNMGWNTGFSLVADLNKG